LLNQLACIVIKLVMSERPENCGSYQITH